MLHLLLIRLQIYAVFPILKRAEDDWAAQFIAQQYAQNWRKGEKEKLKASNIENDIEDAVALDADGDDADEDGDDDDDDEDDEP
jgi:hypothetical protein